MDFALTAEQKQIKDMVSEFVDEEVKPRAAEIDETDEFPADLVREMGELGLMGMPFPEKYGGAGLDYHSYAIGLEEISRGSGGLGTIVAAHTSLAGNMLYEFGNEDQKQTYLTPVNEGTDIGAFALSEPGAGSDVPAMETTAVKDGDEYVVNGGKLWISNGSVADTVIVFAKTDPDAGNKGISSFVVRPEEDDGFIVEGTEHKLGDKGCPTAELRFDDMRIPADRLLGDEGDGFVQALKTLNGGRITIAARSIGIARAALDDAVKYAGEREQFDQPIGDFQAIKHKLADMDTKVQAAKLLMHKAADLKIRDETFIKEAAQAKLYASEISREVANEGIQIHGGYGYTKDFAAERYYRDAKLNEIYEGTSEILRNTIGDWLQK
ncbi:acyl-CoA dehydrogenase [Haloferax mediterranei ATCC 33500]|uniref:Acyl-CoA dehydrogenase n=1 Tax=Haloferax mediterranei (strain ATCC 33500 / DSM 1411 / JCM 8866 / NBRC 14739 / NCIMB 2177 / R-4) TaxID=523841 RepID=I3R3Q8_HALMT|nr:acyl-CoA dehydrogenase [Haloferax mediterranei]AFK18868.1 acyl-CoA dehydrogenase [Haloferax mediterranei ATCC 33500]AHZ21769.1 acyl-CoA dehydrogenase [Haloferax mediterranei ATCC 33500]EMA03274.1 acyl-CoA dehydrogenase [Haloferax mediterranei ATCC 33500]MDX5988961.1 acyl-CoA dehydrogenase [Haloferax mediterranei ATCC 33500]QCQ75354.1 acyl-CoA dehydrogenase [Haloferax mediterranei ATCC 33500]